MVASWLITSVCVLFSVVRWLVALLVVWLEREGSALAMRDRSSLIDRCISAPMLTSRPGFISGVWVLFECAPIRTSRNDGPRMPAPRELLSFGSFVFGGVGFDGGSPLWGFASDPDILFFNLSRSARNIGHVRDHASWSFPHAAHFGCSASQLAELWSKREHLPHRSLPLQEPATWPYR